MLVLKYAPNRNMRSMYSKFVTVEAMAEAEANY